MAAFAKKVGFSGNEYGIRYNPESVQVLKHILKIETIVYVVWVF